MPLRAYVTLWCTINRVQFPTLYIHNNKNFGKVNWEKVEEHANGCPAMAFQ